MTNKKISERRKRTAGAVVGLALLLSGGGVICETFNELFASYRMQNSKSYNELSLERETIYKQRYPKLNQYRSFVWEIESMDSKKDILQGILSASEFPNNYRTAKSVIEKAENDPEIKKVREKIDTLESIYCPMMTTLTGWGGYLDPFFYRRHHWWMCLKE